MLNIYVDGSSRGNPGDGGFGVVIINNNKLEYAFSEQFNNVTNNQMELRAIIHALELIKEKYPEEEVIIHSDSAYCVNMCNDWIWTWSKNDWKNSKKQRVENYELVRKIWKFVSMEFPNFQIVKCSGHSGIIENELADRLANQDFAKFTKILEENGIEYKSNLIF